MPVQTTALGGRFNDEDQLLGVYSIGSKQAFVTDGKLILKIRWMQCSNLKFF